jgi:sulfur carrier protein
MTVTLNGRAQPVEPGLTVDLLLARLSVDARTVLVEHNAEVLPRTKWAGTPLADGDRIELFRVSAGG